MNRFEKKLKRLVKQSTPSYDEWLAENPAVILQSDGAVAKKGLLQPILPVIVILVGLAALIIAWLYKPINKQYGEEDLYYSTISQAEANTLLELPDYSMLQNLTFTGAFISVTNELGYIKLVGIYESETQYIEYVVIVLMKDNVHFLSRELYEQSCNLSSKINGNIFYWTESSIADDTFFGAAAYSKIGKDRKSVV